MSAEHHEQDARRRGQVEADHCAVDGYNIVTRLTVDGVLPALTGSLAVGLLLYTFPAGVHSLKVARMKIALQQTDGNITADVPLIGLGDLIASGAVIVLNGTAGFDNILTEQAADDCDGTVEDKTIVVPTAGHIVNEAAGRKFVYFNAADAWTSTEATCGVSGEVWLSWTRLTSAEE